jgi:hypothetical protein
MKKIITICALTLITINFFGQSPEKMSYQSVIRNTSNALVTNSTVGLRISILQTSPSGSAVYVETQTPTSNANGLVSVEIGAGSIVSGIFTSIDWANGPYFIKTETDPTGGTSYTITGTSQLLSVPYALHAKTAETVTGGITETDPIFGASVASNVTTNDINNWNNDDVQDGDTTYWKVNGGDIYNNVNKIGIGTNTPLYKLHINNPSPNTPMFRLSSDHNLTFNSRSIGFNDPLNNANFSFSYEPPSSGLSINSEPTMLLFVGTSEGSARHFNIRLSGNNRLTVSGNGVTTLNAILKLTPLNSAPVNPDKGMIYMNNSTNKLMVYDGTTWQACW